MSRDQGFATNYPSTTFQTFLCYQVLLSPPEKPTSQLTDIVRRSEFGSRAGVAALHENPGKLEEETRGLERSKGDMWGRCESCFGGFDTR